jgi:hypothetical protein
MAASSVSGAPASSPTRKASASTSEAGSAITGARTTSATGADAGRASTASSEGHSPWPSLRSQRKSKPPASVRLTKHKYR